MSGSTNNWFSSSSVRAILLLTLICAVTYFTGLATHGLTNWQEGQRALVAQEMQANGEWIVPTVNGTPYLAKPPMVYWSQLCLAKVRTLFGGDGTVAVVDLRLTVAIAGWLGVIMTFFVGQILLQASDSESDTERTITTRAAFWAAATLATGFLYVRSSRIGELDILIVPFAVAAIGAIFVSWRSHRERNKMHLGATAVATAAACAAMLTKGPPTVVCIIAGGYGSIIAWSLFSPEASHGIRSRSIECFKAMSRTHPVAVIGAPFGVLWLWLWAVKSRVGADTVSAAVDRQSSENLQFFVLESPLNNLEAMSYGVGLGSAFTIAAIVWLLVHRRNGDIQFTLGHWVLLAWVILSFIAFSSMGKGVARYLTPMWPGMALLGGMWIRANLSNPATAAKRLSRSLAIAVALLALGQGWWYAIERESRFSDRSPDAFITALLSSPVGVDVARLGAIDIWDPRLDYYADHHVQPFQDVGPGVGLSGVSPQPVASLASHLTQGKTYTLLVRETPHPSLAESTAPAIDRLKQLGFIVEPIDLEPAFRVDNRKTSVIAVTISRSN